MKWALVATGLDSFAPPITFGTPPANAQQTWPLAGSTPAPLAEEGTFQLGVIDAAADTTFYEFTR